MKLINSAKFTAVLDANVLYPVVIRDFLMRLSTNEVYTPKWTQKLMDEFSSIFKKKGLSYPEDKIRRQVELMNIANPEAMVEKYESLLPAIKLPDENDRHVVAAAIKSNSNVIVTYNLKDFPSEYLDSLGLEAIDPDNFIADMIDLTPDKCCDAFKKTVYSKRNPPYTEEEYLDIFRNVGLIQTADELEKYLDISSS